MNITEQKQIGLERTIKVVDGKRKVILKPIYEEITRVATKDEELERLVAELPERVKHIEAYFNAISKMIGLKFDSYK